MSYNYIIDKEHVAPKELMMYEFLLLGLSCVGYYNVSQVMNYLDNAERKRAHKANDRRA